MKIRNGFVSNSSSSSFMIAVAKITDIKKASEWLKKLAIDEDPFKYNYSIAVIGEKDEHWSVSNDGKTIRVESFRGDRVEGTFSNPDDKFLAIRITNNEGDWAFSDNDSDWGDIDYDIDLDFFGSKQIDIWNGLTPENGFSEVEKSFGAARNG